MSDRNILNMEDDLIVFGTDQEQISALVDTITELTSEDDMKLVLIDSIGRFDCFYNNSHLLVQPISDAEEQRLFFEWLNKKIRERLELLAGENLTYLEQYNNDYPDNKLPYILIIAHEVTDLNLSENIDVQRALLYDDNAGVYFLVFSKAAREDLKLETELNMFKLMKYDEVLSLITSKGMEP